MHTFRITTTWTGNMGTGTSAYTAYSRNHEVFASGKSQPILGSSDPKFRGDGSRYNPEEMLVGALSTCHLLWMLHLCADAGIAIVAYVDNASGDMKMNPDGSGQFEEVVLRPELTITDKARVADLEALHHRAHELCFISRSVNFSVRVEPQTHVAS